MKKALLPLVCFLMIGFGETKAQWVTIPDSAFVAYLQQEIPTCMVGNQMNTTCSGVAGMVNMYCSYKNISQLTGIQYFINLQVVYVNGNKISSFPSLPASIKQLTCTSNLLSNLPTLPPSITHLYCSDNQLTSLPSLPNSLIYLDCGKNQLTNLPTLPASLTNLQCSDNQLSNLPTFPASFEGLDCSYNQLTNIPSLPVSMTALTCRGNQLTNLPIFPGSFRFLDCRFNLLTSLPSLPASFEYLYCGDNLLTSLPPLPSTLSVFSVNNNPLLLCMPPLKKFTGQAASFDISQTSIKCLPNAITHTGFIPAIDTVPVCDLFNANGCEVGWNIHGAIYVDDNADCTKQPNELNPHSLKMNLYKSGNVVQSGFFSGNYSFDTDLSSYIVAIDTVGLPFSFTCPALGKTTVNLTAVDSLKFDVNFGLKCKTGFDLGVSSIVGNRFRPAWNEMVNIKAGDMANALGGACASGVSGIVNVTITGPAKFVSQALSALTPSSSSSNSATWNIADFITVNSTKDFNIIIQPDTTAQAGQQICITVSVSPTTGDNNPTNNVLTQCFEVRTSYDPNDKAVYPSGDILPEQDWLTYTIRFQNTGNDTAIHVQIIDTLDSDIDMASFKLLAYSHENITQILEGGIVKFNFPNIYLPDSNVNEPLSHGYIQYKVKLKDNLPIGTNISNTAYIYFDFNAPVVTNTTTNTISTATAVSPSPSGRGGVGLFPNPAHNTLTILTSGSNENITITNLLGELMFHERTLNGRKEIDISQWPQGMYFVNQQKFVKQ